MVACYPAFSDAAENNRANMNPNLDIAPAAAIPFRVCNFGAQYLGANEFFRYARL
jgi:hypothetical protein